MTNHIKDKIRQFSQSPIETQREEKAVHIDKLQDHKMMVDKLRRESLMSQNHLQILNKIVQENTSPKKKQRKDKMGRPIVENIDNNAADEVVPLEEKLQQEKSLHLQLTNNTVSVQQSSRLSPWGGSNGQSKLVHDLSSKVRPTNKIILPKLKIGGNRSQTQIKSYRSCTGHFDPSRSISDLEVLESSREMKLVDYETKVEQLKEMGSRLEDYNKSRQMKNIQLMKTLGLRKNIKFVKKASPIEKLKLKVQGPGNKSSTSRLLHNNISMQNLKGKPLRPLPKLQSHYNSTLRPMESQEKEFIDLHTLTPYKRK